MLAAPTMNVREYPLGAIAYHVRALHAGNLVEVSRVEEQHGRDYYALTLLGRNLLEIVLDPWPR